MSTGKAIRLGVRQGSWKSVLINWATESSVDFRKTLTFPEVEIPKGAKVFNQDISVIDRFRLSEGTLVNKEYVHNAKIANQVTQWILIEVDIGKPIQSESDRPDVHVWGFLQPAIIGIDKKRVKQNNGYVTDDIPRAGWFEAKIYGNKNQWEDFNYEEGKNNPAKITSQKLLSEVDSVNPSIIRYKIQIFVRNNETLEDLKILSNEYRKNKHLDLSLIESGCYLKVWARNLKYPWSIGNLPQDDNSESILSNMDNDDPYFLEDSKTYNPQFHRNHTWRRNRILANKNLISKRNGRDNLIYIGLFPRVLIEKLEEFEKEIAKQRSTSETEFPLPAWIGTTLFWLVFGYYMKNVTENMDVSDLPIKGGSNARHNNGEKVKNVLMALGVPKLAAIYACGGFENPLDIAQTLKLSKRFPNGFAYTKLIYQRYLEFLLYSKKEEIPDFNEAEDNKKVESAEKELSHFNPSNLIDKKALEKGIIAWGEKITFPIKITEKSKAFTFPKESKPFVLPGAFAWLSFMLEAKISGSIKGSVTINPDLKTNKHSLEFAINAGSSFSVEAKLQAIWAALAQGIETQKNKDKENPLLKVLKDCTEMVDLELRAGITIEPKIDTKFSFLLNGNEFTTDILPTAKIDFNLPIYAQLTIFTWKYDFANGTVADVDKVEGTFLPKLNWLGKPLNLAKRFQWGVSKFIEFGTLNTPTVNIGSPIEWFIEYTECNSTDRAKTELNYTRIQQFSKSYDTNAQSSGTTAVFCKDLKGIDKKLPTKEFPRGGEIIWQYSISWNPVIPKLRKIISLWDLREKSQKELMEFMRNLLNSKTQGLFVIASYSLPLGGTRQWRKGSVLKIYCPQIEAINQIQRKGNDPALLFHVHIKNYLDTHIWIRFQFSEKKLSSWTELKVLPPKIGALPAGHSGSKSWVLWPRKNEKTDKAEIFLLKPELCHNFGRPGYYRLQFSLMDNEDVLLFETPAIYWEN